MLLIWSMDLTAHLPLNLGPHFTLTWRFQNPNKRWVTSSVKQGYILYQPLVVVAVFPTPKPNVGVADDVADGKPVVGPKLKAIFYVCLAQIE